MKLLKPSLMRIIFTLISALFIPAMQYDTCGIVSGCWSIHRSLLSHLIQNIKIHGINYYILIIGLLISYLLSSLIVFYSNRIINNIKEVGFKEWFKQKPHWLKGILVMLFLPIIISLLLMLIGKAKLSVISITFPFYAFQGPSWLLGLELYELIIGIIGSLIVYAIIGIIIGILYYLGEWLFGLIYKKE
jgi:hypothetical protein